MDRSQWTLSRPSGGYAVGRLVVQDEIIYVLNFSDLHIGSPNCRYDLIEKGIAWAKEHDAICICGGDWMENANKTSVGAGWVEQALRPQEQLNKIYELFGPIKDQFVGGIIGNHEFRTYRDTGIDPMQTICEHLDMWYFGTELMLVISSLDREGRPRRAHTLYACHSASGHKTSGLAMNHVQRDWAFVHADIKMKSHDHQLSYDSEPVLVLNSNSASAKEKLQHLVLTGSTLTRRNGYATVKPHRPTRLGFMPLMLNMKRDDIPGGAAWSVRPVYELAEG